jgi:CspA family cold shock protein
MSEVGTVKRWFSERAFGFLTTDQGDEVFVHVSSCPGSVDLVEGQKVEFERITRRDGRSKAVNVKTLTPAPSGAWRGDI